MPEPEKKRPDTSERLAPAIDSIPPPKRPPSLFSGLQGGLGGLLPKFNLNSLEMEDFIIMLILYLLYRESGDKEWLIILGVMLFL